MGTMMGGGGSFFTQHDFRARVDTVDESTDDGWFAPTNTNFVLEAKDTNLRVRFNIKRDVLNSAEGITFQLYYSRNGGTFTQCTTTSNVVRQVASGHAGYDNDDASTELINTGTGNYITGQPGISEGDNVTGTIAFPGDASNDEFCEIEFVVQFRSVNLTRGDWVELRARSGGANLNGGYDQIMIVSVQEPRLNVSGDTGRLSGAELTIS